MRRRGGPPGVVPVQVDWWRSVVAAAAFATLSAALFSTTATAQVTVGADVTRERSDYHFDAPSSYDTTALVPHFFEQHYVLDNVWFDVTARYRAGVDWNTSVAVTPVRQALATDYDTFFDPGGIVWVVGTTGDARVHSFRIEQQVDLGRTRGVQLSGGYRLRVDQADFLDGDRTDVRNGRVVSRHVVTTREYTSAQSHEIFVRASRTHDLSRHWQVRLAGEASPAAIRRLAIRLPDKYPGQTLVYRAVNMTTSGRVDVARTGSGWPIALHIQLGHEWNYRASQRSNRSAAILGVTAGRAW